MKPIRFALLALLGLAACGEVTQPVPEGDRVQAPAAPSRNTSEANLTIGDIYGPGWPNGSPLSTITQPGNHVWQVSTTSYNNLQQLKHHWQVSGDGGATWHQEHVVTFYSGAWGTVTSQFTRYIPPTANVPFLIRVVATHAGETVTAGPMYVPVDFDLAVSVNGPSVVNSPGTYTWEAMPSYGTGSYTYSWDIEWTDKGSRVTDTHSGKTLTMDMFQQDGELLLTVRAYSGGEVAEASHMVCNFIYPNDVSCI